MLQAPIDKTNLRKGWEETTIGKALKLKSGDFLSAANMDRNGGYAVYGGNGVNGYHSEYMFEESKVVIGRVGAYCGAVYRTIPFSWITDNALYVLEKKANILDIYLELFLTQANLNQYASQSGQPLISGSRLENVPLIILPPAEQERIAAIASKADHLRRTRRYSQQLSDTYLQSVFLEMFGDPVSNPKGWEISTLGELKTDLIYGTSTKCFETPKGLPVLRIPNILNDEINQSNLKYAELPDKEAAKISLRKGDLLFVRTNGNLDYVGRCATFYLEEPYLFASYLIRARLNLDLINPVYVGAFLRTPLGRKIMAPFIRTTAGQFNISAAGLRQVQLLLPPLPLQQKFATIVQNFERLRTQQREAERQAEHLFQSILHRAFRGEL